MKAITFLYQKDIAGINSRDQNLAANTLVWAHITGVVANGKINAAKHAFHSKVFGIEKFPISQKVQVRKIYI